METEEVKALIERLKKEFVEKLNHIDQAFLWTERTPVVRLTHPDYMEICKFRDEYFGTIITFDPKGEPRMFGCPIRRIHPDLGNSCVYIGNIR